MFLNLSFLKILDSSNQNTKFWEIFFNIFFTKHLQASTLENKCWTSILITLGNSMLQYWERYWYCGIVVLGLSHISIFERNAS